MHGSGGIVEWIGRMKEVLESLNPAWITAFGAVVGAVIALRIVVHWCMVRWVFRGSATAIVALFGEPSCEARCTEGISVAGRISSESKDVYVVVGEERYLLCRKDLYRLREYGYIYRSGSSSDQPFVLSRLGELFMSRYDNSPWLARGIRRVRRPSRFRCNGNKLLWCRCEKRTYRVGGLRIPLPCFLWNT